VPSIYLLPPSLPPGLRDGHGFEPLPNARVRDRDQGEARMRPRFRSVPDRCTITWRFTQAEFDVFDEWFENTIVVGTEDFDLQVADRATEQGISWWTARFIGEYERADASGLRYRVSATLLLVDEIGAVRVPPGIEASGGITFDGEVSFEPAVIAASGDIAFDGGVSFDVPDLLASGDIAFDGGVEMSGGTAGSGLLTESGEVYLTEGGVPLITE
jgi:hypothetical protein